MRIFKRKTRKEVVESKIESLFDEVASLDFTNEEIAHIAQGFKCKARRVLRLRAEQLCEDLTKTLEALDLINRSDERKEADQFSEDLATTLDILDLVKHSDERKESEQPN